MALKNTWTLRQLFRWLRRATIVWILECSCRKEPKNWFTPIPRFSNSETGPEVKWVKNHIAVWCQSQPRVPWPQGQCSFHYLSHFTTFSSTLEGPESLISPEQCAIWARKQNKKIQQGLLNTWKT
ncbi:unnamed protein product [Pipistrellus nathusii]|uniref:Uncharacterized protein n=1 Tax=Pipistrellus nathusii TaxID=59473 RepID=A0ABP0ACD4_PIPNA